MAKDLLSPRYPAQLVEEITGIDLITQRNWIAREGYGVTSILEHPLAGKPRMWPLIGVYENAGMAEAKAHGIDPVLFARAMYRRIEQVGIPELIRTKPSFTPRGTIAYFEGEMITTAVEGMPELVQVDRDNPFMWVVNYGEDRSVTAIRVIRRKEATVFGELQPNGGPFLAFNITNIVASIDEKLSRTVRVKMRTRAAGPKGIFEPDSIVELPLSEASAMIVGGFAVVIGDREDIARRHKPPTT